MTPPLVFVDTETTGLSHLARPWEIAAVYRGPHPAQVRNGVKDPDQVVHEHLWIVDYTPSSLPPGTEPDALRIGGWETRGRMGLSGEYCGRLYDDEGVFAGHGPEFAIARAVHTKLQGATLVGVGTHFDAAVLSAMFRRHGLAEQPWHYAIHDLKSMAYGHALARGLQPGLPMNSEALAHLAAVPDARPEDRHTALGDARWAARWWDALHGQGCTGDSPCPVHGMD